MARVRKTNVKVFFNIDCEESMKQHSQTDFDGELINCLDVRNSTLKNWIILTKPVYLGSVH